MRETEDVTYHVYHTYIKVVISMRIVLRNGVVALITLHKYTPITF